MDEPKRSSHVSLAIRNTLPVPLSAAAVAARLGDAIGVAEVNRKHTGRTVAEVAVVAALAGVFVGLVVGALLGLR